MSTSNALGYFNFNIILNLQRIWETSTQNTVYISCKIIRCRHLPPFYLSLLSWCFESKLQAPLPLNLLLYVSYEAQRRPLTEVGTVVTVKKFDLHAMLLANLLLYSYFVDVPGVMSRSRSNPRSGITFSFTFIGKSSWTSCFPSSPRGHWVPSTGVSDGVDFTLRRRH